MNHMIEPLTIKNFKEDPSLALFVLGLMMLIYGAASNNLLVILIGIIFCSLFVIKQLNMRWSDSSKKHNLKKQLKELKSKLYYFRELVDDVANPPFEEKSSCVLKGVHPVDIQNKKIASENLKKSFPINNLFKNFIDAAHVLTIKYPTFELAGIISRKSKEIDLYFEKIRKYLDFYGLDFDIRKELGRERISESEEAEAKENFKKLMAAIGTLEQDLEDALI